MMEESPRREPRREECCSCAHADWEDLGLHGIRRLVRSKNSCPRRAYWVILLLLVLALLVYNALGCVVKYLSYPTSVTYRIISPEREDTPALTICNLNPLRLSVLYQEDWLGSMQTIYSVGYGTSKTVGKTANMSSRTVYSAAGHSISNMLLGCLHGIRECSANNFSTSLTELGSCYTFPQLGLDELHILFNIENYEYSGISDGRVGLSIQFHAPTDQPIFPPFHITVPPGAHTHVDVFSSKVYRMSPPHGPCEASSTSQERCLATCINTHITRQCGCSPFWTTRRRGDPPDCSIYSHVRCVMKEAHKLLTTHQHLKQVCSCPEGCEYSLFVPSALYSNLYSRDLEAYLAESMRTAIATDKIFTENIRRRALHTNEDLVSEALAFSRVMDDFRYQVDNLKRNVKKVRENLLTFMEQLNKRTWFHYYVGLAGIQKTLKNSFLPSWEQVNTQFLQPLLADTHTLLNMYDSVTKKLTDQSEVSSRRILYLNMEEQLSSRMELAIQGLENFTIVYYSFLDRKPLTSYIATPERRYDATLIPIEAFSEVENTMREEYAIIADHLARYMEQVLVLRNILKDAYLSPTGLNKTASHAARATFSQRNQELLKHVGFFRVKITNKLQDIVQRHADQFKKTNDTFFIAALRLDSALEEVSAFLELVSLHNYPHLVEFAQDSQIYTTNYKKLTSELADIGLKNAVKDNLDMLMRNIRRLGDFGDSMDVLWERFADQSLGVWNAMLDSPSLRPFYAKLHADVQRVINDPAGSAQLLEIFAHKKLLGVSERQLSGVAPETLSVLLNADLPLLTAHGKEAELRETCAHNKRLTDISLHIQSLDTALQRAFDSLTHQLAAFMRAASISDDFIRESLVSVSIRMATYGHEELEEHPTYVLVQLISELGSLLPLFLGASTVTIFEILDVMCTSLCCQKSSSSKQRLDDDAEQTNPRHVTFQVPSGNHVTSLDSRPSALKKPRFEHIEQYPPEYPNAMTVVHTFDDSHTEIL